MEKSIPYAATHIQSVRIANLQTITPVEFVLARYNPKWKDGPLYTWQWDNDRREDLALEKLYSQDLTDKFQQIDVNFSGRLFVRPKKKLLILPRAEFIVESFAGSFGNVLTNALPENIKTALDSLGDSGSCLTLDQLRRIYFQ